MAEFTVMGVMGALMMLSMIVSPGVQAGIHMKDLRQSIDDANANYDDLDKKWNAVLKKQAELGPEMKTSITNTFTNINDSISKANESHDLIKGQCKQIQYLGIMMILFIFILLLLKHFDLFDTLSSIITYPVTFYKKYI